MATLKILFVFNCYYSLSFLFHYTLYIGFQIWLVKYPYTKKINRSHIQVLLNNRSIGLREKL